MKNLDVASLGVPRALLLVLAVAVTLVMQRLLTSPLGQLLFLDLCIIVFMALAVVFRAETRLPLLCDPLVIVYVFMAQFFVIGAPALFVLDFHIFRQLSPERGLLILGLFAIFTVAFFAGYQLRLGQVIAGFLPDFEGTRPRMPWIWIETLVTGVGLAGCVAFVLSQGGLMALLRTGYGMGDSQPIYQLAYHMLFAGTLLMAWRVIAGETTHRWAWAPLMGVLAFEILFFGVLSGARKWLFYLFFGLLAMRLLRRGTRAIPKLRVALILAALVLFFSVWGAVRTRPLTELVGAQATDARVVGREPFYMGYFKSVSEPFEVASLVVDIYPAQQPYEHGRPMLVTVLGFIPRSVWPDKPVGLGKSLTRYTDGYLFQAAAGHSIAPTLVGDFYASFGLIGVVFGGLAFGVACRAIAAYASMGLVAGVQLTAARVIIPAVFVAGLAEVRGESAFLLAFYIMVLTPISLCCGLSRLSE
ncbi:MAG TPA: O-antigen polymerase [Candidatus Polarisedimenticolaceae bacterium]|nr:O-antigen polymerase [Candidatus Polarisedimenticolaceae bacterium]